MRPILVAALLLFAPACTSGPRTVDSAALSSGASQPIDLANPDTALLSAVIEQLSDVARSEAGRANLEPSAALRKAADKYARKMVRENFLAHHDPNTSSLKTPSQRAAAAGVKNPHIAENLADVPGFQVESGEPFYVLDPGPPIISREPDGEPIPAHTYGSFAQTVVQGWLNSPGHRKNLLDDEALQIGVGAARAERNGIPTFVVVQKFQLYEQTIE